LIIASVLSLSIATQLQHPWRKRKRRGSKQTERQGAAGEVAPPISGEAEAPERGGRELSGGSPVFLVLMHEC
jgi:hypothetical protein